MYHRVTILLAFLLATAFQAVVAQDRPPIDWDLTYQTLLDRNQVPKDSPVRRWLAHVNLPAEKWIKGWKGKPITASILIEYPAFHAAERQTIWLIRTADESHYWELTEGLGLIK